jgi:peptidoglycan biosynthesis protein MviN/MurJ (putative lipid II flippase)
MHHLGLSRISAHRERWRTAHRITTGLIAVALFLIVAKAIAAGKEIVVAQAFGTSAALEGYLFVFTLYSVIASTGYSVMFAVLVPLLAAKSAFPQSNRQFRSEALGLVLILGLVLGVLSALVVNAWVTRGTSGLSPECTAAALGAIWPLSVTVVLALLAGLISTFIMSAGGHANTLFEAGPAIGIAVAVIVWPDASVGPLVFGTIAGYCLQLSCLAWLLRNSNSLSTPVLRFNSPQWRDLQLTLALVILTYLLTGLGGALDLYFASGLEQGSIASMGYANRIMALFLGLLATAVGRAALPSLSSTYADEPVDTTRVAIRYAWILGLVGMAAFVLVAFGAHRIVSLMFQRGAFSDTDTDRVSDVLVASGLQLPFYAAGLVILSLLTGARRYLAILVITALALATKVGSASLLVPLFGLQGLMVSNAIMHATTLVGSSVAVFATHRTQPIVTRS